MPSRIYDNLKISKVAIGNSHSLGIIDGNIVGWGSDAKGKLDFSSIGGSKVIDIACGYSHSACVTEDGRLHSFGNSRDGKAGRTISDCVSVRCSRNYTAALQVIEDNHKIHVFGSQSKYRAIPSAIYSSPEKNWGIFDLGKFYDYCISDDGELTVASCNGDLVKVGTHKMIVGNVMEMVVGNYNEEIISQVVNPPAECAALFLISDGRVMLSRFDMDGKPYSKIHGTDAVSVFSGDTYWGYAAEDGLALFGDHFGNIKIPHGTKIRNAFGGNNGYAVSVCENGGATHTVLCGVNTKNKELVIGDYPSRENPKVKTEEGDDSVIFDVRMGKGKPVTVVDGTVEKCELQFECSDCEYKFVSEGSTCPLCNKEATVNG